MHKFSTAIRCYLCLLQWQKWLCWGWLHPRSHFLPPSAPLFKQVLFPSLLIQFPQLWSKTNAEPNSAEQDFCQNALFSCKNPFADTAAFLAHVSSLLAFTSGNVCPCWYQKAELEVVKASTCYWYLLDHWLELGLLQRGKNHTYHSQCHSIPILAKHR